MKRSPRNRRAAPLLAVLFLASCATLPGPFAGGRQAPSDGEVEVRNPHWDDLTVYVEREGALLRLGIVPGNTDRTLTVPGAYLSVNGRVRLVARAPDRSTRAVSEDFEMARGRRMGWAIGLASTPSAVTALD